MPPIVNTAFNIFCYLVVFLAVGYILRMAMKSADFLFFQLPRGLREIREENKVLHAAAAQKKREATIEFQAEKRAKEMAEKMLEQRLKEELAKRQPPPPPPPPPPAPKGSIRLGERLVGDPLEVARELEHAHVMFSFYKPKE